LSDVTRQRLLCVLMRSEFNVSELVEILGLPQSTISRHLKALREAGLVQDRPIGPATLYAASQAFSGRLDEEAAVEEIQPLLLGWFQRQGLPAALEARIERVLARRSGDTQGFFNRLGRRWDELRRAAFGDSFALEALVSLLPPEWRVADIGCGTGYLLPLLARHFAEVTAVEPAETMLECARHRVAEHRLDNVTLLRGDLADLPLAGASVDLAMAILVLHHVPQPAEALHELARVVRPGGRLLVVEQQSHENQAFYDRMQDLWWGFSPRDLSDTCQTAGFRNLRHSTLASAESSADVDAPPLFVLTAERGT
jgi:ArsR family transcriptional regulator